jgi:GDSL-like lipase/acylhydrolase family protein
MRLARGLANLGLAATSVGVSLLAMEMVVRWLYGAPPHWRIPQVKHEITRYGYKPVPHQVAYSGGASVHTNAYGFRGPEWAVPKTPGAVRVMVLGDSLSFGNLVAYDETFAARLHQALRTRDPAAEVVLAASGGWDTAQELAFLEVEGLGYQPDIVVLGFFFNDYRLPSDSARPVALMPEGRVDERPGWLRWVPYRLVYGAKRSALVTYLRNRVANFLSGRADRDGPGFYAALMDNQVAVESEERIVAVHQMLGRMNALCAARGVRLLVAHVPPINLFWHPRGSRAYLAHLQRFCREGGIEFLDLSDRFWAEPPTEALYLYPWDTHLSPRGHAAAAEELARVVGAWLESGRGRETRVRSGEWSISVSPRDLG